MGVVAAMYTNYGQKEINLKIVYYGAGLGGKTTNLQKLHAAAPATSELLSLATETDRTLFFDFMPLEVGKVRDFKVRLHLYTVPGQVFYAATRRLVVRGADAVVLVADSQDERMDANLLAVHDLKADLASYGIDLQELPYVVQLNKRDLPGVISVEQMREELNFKGEPFIEASAVQGLGVQETLKEVTRQVMQRLRESNKLASVLASAAATDGGASAGFSPETRATAPR
jgi:signal recognition particle receptor subunit beta